ncbi:MAG: hypothetical protein M1829_006808 [Trizodia sp. TS-e1964]|nr:MAG: hypothetical protein M1829_006808 [Trizodia sp. TS-e1964]
MMETYQGHVRTPADAIVLFEACRLGLLPRVQRRLSEKERQSIRSGSVFVWDEREAGMRRWTDGKSWSASRVSGSFLTYREMEGKRGGPIYHSLAASTSQRRAGKTPDSARGSDSDQEMGEEGPDGYRYKPDGLMKQSFSITTSAGQHLHLISYYARSHPGGQNLCQPSNDPQLRGIRIQKGMYPESTIHEPQNTPAPASRPPLGASSFLSSPHNVPAAQLPSSFGRTAAPHQHMYASNSAFGWPPSPAITPPSYNNYPYPAHGSALPIHQPLPGSGPPQYTSLTSAASPSLHYSQPHPLAGASSLPSLHPQPQAPPQLPRGSSPGLAAQRSAYTSPHLAHDSLGSFQQQQAPQIQLHQQSQQLHSPNFRNDPNPDPRFTTILKPQPLPLMSPLQPRIPDQYDTNPAREVGNMSKTIPSIGSLMGGSSDIGDAARSDPSTSRAGSRSPCGTQRSATPKDIPSDKMNGFREDQRAIRVLDRVFKA